MPVTDFPAGSDLLKRFPSPAPALYSSVVTSQPVHHVHPVVQSDGGPAAFSLPPQHQKQVLSAQSNARPCRTFRPVCSRGFCSSKKDLQLRLSVFGPWSVHAWYKLPASLFWEEFPFLGTHTQEPVCGGCTGKQWYLALAYSVWLWMHWRSGASTVFISIFTGLCSCVFRVSVDLWAGLTT